MRGIRSPRGLAFSPDGRKLAAFTHDSAIVWDLAADREIVRLALRRGRYRGLTFAPDGKTLAIGDELRRLVLLWDTMNDKTMSLRLPEAYRAEGGGWIPFKSLVFTADGKRLAASVSGPKRKTESLVFVGAIVLWSTETGEEVGHFEDQLRGTPGDDMVEYSLIFSSLDTWLLSASKTRVTVRDSRTWRVVATKDLSYGDRSRAVDKVVFSPDCRRVAAIRFPISWGNEGNLFVWEIGSLFGSSKN